MERLNTTLLKVNSRIVMGLLIIIPIGLCYRLLEAYYFESMGVNSEWMSLVFIFLIVLEFYLVLMFFWLKLISRSGMNQTFKFIQLLFIILFAIIPGILALYPAFIKD